MLLIMTNEEHELIAQYVRIMNGVEDVETPKWKNKRRTVYYKICRLIDRYGEDGMGDKPPKMNRVAYWLAHME